MKTDVLFSDLAAIQVELLAVTAVDAQTEKGPDAKPQPALLTGDPAVTAAAAAVLASGEFKAGANETLLLHSPAGLAARRLLIVGLGKAGKPTVHSVRAAAGTAVRFAKPRGIREIAFALPAAAELPPGPCSRAATEGALLADPDWDTFRSDRKDLSVATFQLVAAAGEKAAVEAGHAEGVIVAGAQNFARVQVNEPGNILTPTVLGQRAAEMAESIGLKWEVYHAEKLHELKMGAFWAVAKGSAEQPALIVLTYEPEGYDAATYSGPVIGLVGKGITFDTGGISIKPADKMEMMKYDMAGAAAMLGAMCAIGQVKPKVKVICVVCSAENMPDGKAYKPGDVAISMPDGGKPGKGIEIINTDAEGRLVLADGLTYARQLGCTHLIDAATLTGACVVALGPVNAGGFSNDDETYAKFHAALEISGEKVWRLPLGDEYMDQIKSDIGDIKNTGGRWGGAITAAEFLHVFASETPWIHLDIAGMAWYEDSKPYIAKGPSGFGVRSILEWVRSYEQ
jgi:leucyl aminopeptidase